MSRVASAADFNVTIERLIAELAATPAEALRMTKSLFYALDGTSIGDGIALAARVNVEARRTEAFREGIRRFAPRPGKS